MHLASSPTLMTPNGSGRVVGTPAEVVGACCTCMEFPSTPMTAVKIRVVILGPLVTLRLLSPALEKSVLPPCTSRNSLLFAVAVKLAVKLAAQAVNCAAVG